MTEVPVTSIYDATPEQKAMAFVGYVLLNGQMVGECPLGALQAMTCCNTGALILAELLGKENEDVAKRRDLLIEFTQLAKTRALNMVEDARG